MNKLVFDRPTIAPYGEDIWELRYDWTIVFRGEFYPIPAGTMTDGASIPRWLWGICGHPLQQPRLCDALGLTEEERREALDYARTDAEPDALDAQGGE